MTPERKEDFPVNRIDMLLSQGPSRSSGSVPVKQKAGKGTLIFTAVSPGSSKLLKCLSGKSSIGQL